jgi:imidazolonepropionase
MLEWVPTFLGAHAIPPEYDGRTQQYAELVAREMLPLVAEEGLAEFCDVFCEENYFSAAQARMILSAARQLGMKLKIHAEEFSDQGGATLAAELGAVSADHLEHISEEGIAALRSSGTVAVLLPGTAFNLGLRQYPPARRLIDSGVPVALATDFNPGSNCSPNLQLMMAIACSQMRMTPAEAITAATINGACALARGRELSSLKPGKQADIICH